MMIGACDVRSTWRSRARDSTANHAASLISEGAHRGSVPITLVEPLSPSPPPPVVCTTSTSRASSQVAGMPCEERYDSIVMADHTSPYPDTTSSAWAGTLFSSSNARSADPIASASARMSRSTSSAAAAEAICRATAICSAATTSSSRTDSFRSLFDVSTMLISLSVTPARADTMAIVGTHVPMVGLCRLDSETSSSAHWMYSSGVASDAPPNLCTSHGTVATSLHSPSMNIG
mmetsp:Transcript_18504/g.60595  ORF Transcript_18504/g.60595 Transcript_18504/m.60595 type:complete len:233 (+) Transcript_18504:2908-3606(+)